MKLSFAWFSRPLMLGALLTGVLVATGVSHAGSKNESKKPVITHPKYDATADRVGLFAGIEDERLGVKFVPQGSEGGFILVTNKSEQPLTVELPEAFVAVQVLKQFGGGGLGGGGLGGGGLGGGGLGGGQGGGGQNQNAGGGFGGGGQGGGGLGGGGLGGGGLGGGGGQGFFSIPPERTVRVPYVSACLNHGKADPSPNLEYKLVAVSEYTKDPVLSELITMVGSGRVPQHSAQAAIWTRTDNMSWQQLAAKNTQGIHGRISYFTPADLTAAQYLMATAEGRVREKAQQQERSPESRPESRDTVSRVR